MYHLLAVIVNFINDVTIACYPAQTGATVTEVNKSAATTGVTISSGNLAIDQSELPNAKIYQIKLSNGVQFFSDRGNNNYICNSFNFWQDRRHNRYRLGMVNSG